MPSNDIELTPLEWLDIQVEDGRCVTRIKPECRDEYQKWVDERTPKPESE